jgi:1,4-dihydroxy-2-naphthoyl-CoA hydrolase
MTGRADPAPDASGDPLDDYRALRTRGLSDTLGIEIDELSPDRVVATMPVDDRTRQPFGILHGGASVALAETAISLGAWRSIDRARFAAVGLEINANHLRAKTEGTVRIVATPVHRGRTTQVWTAEIRDEKERLVCVARCTMAIVPRDVTAGGDAEAPVAAPTRGPAPGGAPAPRR